MKKVDFDMGVAAQAGRQTDLRTASQTMERNRELLQAPGVLGMWVGARSASPYIMLAVNEAAGPALSQAIPDIVDGIRVYYIEGRYQR